MSEKSEGKGKPKRLGKGLSALIGDLDETESVSRVREEDLPGPVNEVDISNLKPNPGQPRKTFSEAELSELAESIRLRGVLQPILVRPDPKKAGSFQIVAGERRFRAAQTAGLKSVPVIIKEMDELEVLEIAIIENVQRQDLNPVEEAEAYGQLMKRFGRTQEGLAESVGKSRVHIANTLRLLKLPEHARELLREGKVSAGHARAALSAHDPDMVLDAVVARNLSVRDTEKLVRQSEAGGDKAERPGEAEEKDVDTQALEADLARKLGLGVDIRHGAKGGELRIKYKNLEQLDDICARLSRARTG
jgi:ParB family transcriptional regulator, chromosome partitioning protein